ncbi:MAG: TonB-dependent receptor, partial [Immundisolibacteraceae bacterium]|nr:TonB-dependent receptor [Immundisolibacteraceae bacterium]
MKLSTRLGGLVLVFLSQFVVADIDIDSAATKLSPIIVTATRTAQSLDQTLASVTVITREQLEKRQVSSVAEALNGVVGLQFTSTGGVGKSTSVFMRGTQSGHLLVLVDGVKVGSATLGSAAFEHIPIQQIERIEVVRGPRASLYGSEAVGGVIQIFTRDGREGKHLGVAMSAGSHNFTGSSFSYGDRVGNTWFSVSAEVQDTDGINVCDGGCFTVEPDRDAYDRKSGSFRIGHQFSKRLKAEFHANQATGDTEADSAFVSNNTEYLQQVVGAKVGWDLTNDWLLSFQVGTSRSESENDLNGVFVSINDTKRITRSIQSDYQVNDQQSLSLGYDFQDDLVTSTVAYAERSRRNEGFFGMYQLQLKKWSFNASARRDSNEQFGSHNTGSVAVGYFLDSGTTITLSHGTAFKAPNFDELYFPSLFGFPAFGNPDLKPSESKSTE